MDLMTCKSLSKSRISIRKAFMEKNSYELLDLKLKIGSQKQYKVYETLP